MPETSALAPTDVRVDNPAFPHPYRWPKDSIIAVLLPDDFVEVRSDRRVVFMRPAIAGWVRRASAAGLTLHEAAARAPGAIPIRGGRGTVYLFEADGVRAVVRRYQRGGGMRFLGDRYLRIGSSRPYQETVASEAATDRGIRTARVLAGSVYRAGVFYRADLITEYVPSTTTLAALLAEGGISPEDREAALHGAGILIARMAAVGVRHADLNAGNILLQRSDQGYDPIVLDLDRMFVGAAGVAVDPNGMLARLERSLKKLEVRTGMMLLIEEWQVLKASAGRAV